MLLGLARLAVFEVRLADHNLKTGAVWLLHGALVQVADPFLRPQVVAALLGLTCGGADDHDNQGNDGSLQACHGRYF